MIVEALNYAATWPLTPPAFRPFVRSSVNLWSRANRCARDWREHEENCHAQILACTNLLKTRRTCVVLGSGLLRDVPVEALAKSFDTVVLVDLVHLASVRTWLLAKRLGNVRLVHRDLSGLEALVGGSRPEPLAFLRQVPYLDLVISANLLSQIGIGVKRQAERQGLPENAVPQLIAAHLEGLKALPCPALLLTDRRFDIVDKAGTVEDGVDLMHGVGLPEADAEWTWPVAPLGEISKTYALRHHVTASLLNRPARGKDGSS